MYTVVSITHFLVDKSEVRLLNDKKGLLKYAEIPCNFRDFSLPKNLKWSYTFNKTTYYAKNSLLTDVLAVSHYLGLKKIN